MTAESFLAALSSSPAAKAAVKIVLAAGRAGLDAAAGEGLEAAVPAILAALRAGVSSDRIVAAVKATMIETSDSTMRAELGGDT